MQLNFATYQTALSITPSDTVPNNFRAIYVGGTGDLAVKSLGGAGATAVTFKAVPIGTIIPVETAFVMSTNTTATLLIGLA